jgi:hypothetical protein
LIIIDHKSYIYIYIYRERERKRETSAMVLYIAQIVLILWIISSF